MAKYTAQDCRDLAIALLSDSSSGFNAYIGTINTERTHSTPTANSITYKWGMNQFPFIFVDIDSSEVQTDDLTLPSNYDNLPEIHTLMVMGFLKYANDNLQNYAEDWIEAIQRVLHMYNDSNVTWIFYTNTDRAEMYKTENETFKSFSVNFEVRIN